MNFYLETMRMGLWNLRLHLLRSCLTSLGIILGVAAVILMVSIGEGNKQAALRDIQELGANNIIVRSQKPPESTSVGSQRRSFLVKYGLLDEDLSRIHKFIPDARQVIPLKTVGSEVSYEHQRITSQTYGTLPELGEVLNLNIAEGRYLSPQDQELRRPVAVIGHRVAEQFFRLENPIGKEIRIDRRVFTIVGVLGPVGLSGGAGGALVGRDLNLDVHIPLGTAESEFGDVVVRRVSGSFSGEQIRYSEIYVTVDSSDEVIATSERIQKIMDASHADRGDVELIVPWELLENVKRTTFAMNLLLTSIAAISLLVGGIGIMNIMLASVIERTREIGIRRALGATRKHIVSQFLVETGTLSAVGGLLGIILGVSLSIAVARVLPWLLQQPAFKSMIETEIAFETQITPWSIIVSFLVASLTGLVFGIYPAIVASKQDPIVALRHE
ncbi:MAG: ABC transporter permease [Planctomycetota bacterium]|nr:ABC transporter permease [Planctomycetota bacterium]